MASAVPPKGGWRFVEAPPRMGDAGPVCWASVDSKGHIIQVTPVLEVATAWFDHGATVRPLQWAGPAAVRCCDD